MNKFCDSPLWSYNLTWDIKRQPDLTPCFQDTLLIWFPCLILWIFAPLQIISILHSKRRYIPFTILNISKAFLSLLLSITCIIELIEVLERQNSETLAPVEYVSPIVKSLTYALAFGLILFHRKRGINTSGLMLLFWLLISLATIVNVRSIFLSESKYLHHLRSPRADWHLSKLQFVLRVIACPVAVIQFLLACIADPLGPDGEQLPELEASMMSRITIWWLNSLMFLGFKRALTQEDLYPLRLKDKTDNVSQKFDRILQPLIDRAVIEKRFRSQQDSSSVNETTRRGSWIPLVLQKAQQSKPLGREEIMTREEGKGSRYVSISSVIFFSFWWSIIQSTILKFIGSLLDFSSPLLLEKIINFIEIGDEPNWRGLLYASVLFLLSIVDSFATNREQYLSNLNVMRVRTCITSALYRKTLKLSNQGRKKYTTGQIVNLMAIDTQRISDIVKNLNSYWATPLQLIISMVLLYQQLGLISTFAGLSVMLLNIPLNAWVVYRLRKLQEMVVRFKDRRTKLLYEILNGIKIIKIHAWEESFKRRVDAIRSSEIANLTKQTFYSAVLTFAFSRLTFVVSLVSFATYVLIDRRNVLDATKIFVSLSLFNIIRIPLANLPNLITNYSLFIVAVRRVDKFLEGDEIDPDAIEPMDDNINAIKIEGGSFKWDRKDDATLKNINFIVPQRSLVAVVGSVGSGKSSLLSAVLGDLEKCEGSIKVDQNSSMAYVPQEAWILNTTFRNNIMFNKVIDEEKYQKVIEACALAPDLKTFALGDQSEIGEKGLNLSGGQKQRVSLARAVYADADIFLLDDPLNAVDAHVGRHIFDNIIGSRGILNDRTRVLVTNKLSILPEVDYIYVLKDGKISESGTYEQLLKNRGMFSQLLLTYLLENTEGVNLSDSDRTELITKELNRLEQKLAIEATENKSTKEFGKKVSSIKEGKSGKKSEYEKELSTDSVESKNLTGKETTKIGSVGLDVHLNLFRTFGFYFLLAIILYIVSSVFTLFSSSWLSEWSDDAAIPELRYDTHNRNVRLGVYAVLGLGESTFVVLSTLLLNQSCLKGSKMLHENMLARILKAPMSWFNITPTGRILNRFSKDIDTVDVTIRFNLRMLLIVGLRAATALILASTGSAYNIIFILPVVLVYIFAQIFYVATSRQLKRIESTTRSPIYSNFSETVSGLTSVRAFGVGEDFILESNRLVDTNNSSFYTSFVATRWLALRLEFLGSLMVLTTSMIAVLARDSISAGLAGLSVSYSLTITSALSLLVRTYSDYETNVVSVERLLEYTRTPIEPEDNEEPADKDWPAKGAITFDNLSARYRPELDLVLNRFSLEINPSERVGLVGRTGAGKSSTFLALFRIIDAAEGNIIIDEVNISHINLKTLRSKLSIIPQDPILFTGTIRQNVDPTESYEDDEIWKAIDLAHLGNFLRTLPEGLDHEVAEGGSNFSVGQKQLFCLARTLIRRSKILVLDEATAAVDVETDDLIQRTIREEFKDSTILTIAHRIDTILDYDKIVVMQDGRLAEEGTPAELLRDTRSEFYSLAKEAGLTN